MDDDLEAAEAALNNGSSTYHKVCFRAMRNADPYADGACKVKFG